MFILRETCLEKKDGREKHQLVISPIQPDQESNLQCFGAWDDAPTNQATWVHGMMLQTTRAL